MLRIKLHIKWLEQLLTPFRKKQEDPDPISLIMQRLEAIESQIDSSMGMISRQIKQFDTRQTDISIMQDELADEFREQTEELNRHTEEREREMERLLDAMIFAADYAEDFYHYAVQSQNEALLWQARMMVNGIAKKYAQAGLIKTQDEYTRPDVTDSRVVGIRSGQPEGVVAENIRSGYFYRERVIRKSEVIVFKPEGEDEV